MWRVTKVKKKKKNSEIGRIVKSLGTRALNDCRNIIRLSKPARLFVIIIKSKYLLSFMQIITSNAFQARDIRKRTDYAYIRNGFKK